MRDVACAICKETDCDLLYEGTVDAARTTSDELSSYAAHYRINRCRRCGLVYSSPVFESQRVRYLYTHTTETNVPMGEEVGVRKTMERYYSLVRPLLRARERVLDIGCDIGILLDIARQDGFGKIYGIEPNPVAADAAATLPGAIISKQIYEAQDFPDDFFDLAILVHVLDHLEDPADVLHRVRRHLKPEGLVLAAVHNVRSLLAVALGERFPPYNLYHHWFFSKATLQRLFEVSGFEVVKIASTRNYYSLGYFVQKVPGLAGPLKSGIIKSLDTLGLARSVLAVPLGNIGIVSRRPRAVAAKPG